MADGVVVVGGRSASLGEMLRSREGLGALPRLTREVPAAERSRTLEPCEAR